MDVIKYCNLVRSLLLSLEYQKNILKAVVEEINSTNSASKQGISGGYIYTAGNGGSAAVASHFAQGLYNKGYNAKCLSDSIPIITGIANDYDYQYVFSNQLKKVGINDIVVIFSVSGNSKNLCMLKNSNAKIIGILGNNGGEVSRYCNIALTFDSKHFQSVEDVFSIIAHLIELEVNNIND